MITSYYWVKKDVANQLKCGIGNQKYKLFSGWVKVVFKPIGKASFFTQTKHIASFNKVLI